MERIALSKKLRFNVFKRDLFTCQYCGSTPPGAVLEVDHMHPVSKGGSNDIDNLITACFSCNRGKSDGLISSLPTSVADKAAILAEKMEQLKAYEKLLKSARAKVEKSIDAIEQVIQSHYGDVTLSESSRRTVRGFLDSIDKFQLEDYMHRACTKVNDNPSMAYKYFCGICWNVIKGKYSGSR
jgi:hypothetical protein